MYLDYAEDQARKHIPMHMADWEEKLNAFLTFTGRKVLNNAGKVSTQQAKDWANEQYAIFDAHRHEVDNLIEDTKSIRDE